MRNTNAHNAAHPALVLLIVAACGGDGNVAADAAPNDASIDARPNDDAMRSVCDIEGSRNQAQPGDLPCHPVSQQGCADGEKCGVLQVAEDVIVTDCSPEDVAPVQPGEECLFLEDVGESAFSNCASGSECIGGQCRTICSTQGGVLPHQGTCGVQQNCQPGVCFTDDSLFQEFSDVGVCLQRCDDASDCLNNQTCIFDVNFEPAVGVCI